MKPLVPISVVAAVLAQLSPVHCKHLHPTTGTRKVNPPSVPNQQLLFPSNDSGILHAHAAGALTALDTYYNANTGRYGEPWWFTAIATNLLITYADTVSPRDPQFLSRASEIIDFNKGVLPWWPSGGGKFRADSTDDTAWWALALLDLWDATGRVTNEYLEMAVKDEEYMWKYWSDVPCGGGIWWDAREFRYKNTVSNGLYVKLAARLHNIASADARIVNGTGGTFDFLDRAEKAWNWIRDSGIINEHGLLNDGVDEIPESHERECANNGQPTWTYNQGVAIGALLELHRANDSAGYLQDARAIADAVLASDMVSNDRILIEPCDRDCLEDQGQFKGIFMRELVGLVKVLGDSEGEKYREFILHNAEVLVEKSRQGDFYGYLWQGPFSNSSAASQTSAANLLVAALRVGAE